MKTILLVDDDSLLLTLYEEVLRRSGYSVIARPDGRSALAVVKEGRSVDLVITDCQMPGMDGFEFLALLKQRAPSLPVLMMSSEMSFEKYAKAIDLGAIECMEKPASAMNLQRIAATMSRPAEDGVGAKLNCWEVLRCGRGPGGSLGHSSGICPAAADARLNGVHGGINAGRACWVLPGTWGAKVAFGAAARKLKN